MVIHDLRYQCRISITTTMRSSNKKYFHLCVYESLSYRAAHTKVSELGFYVSNLAERSNVYY